ncbi:hypothetical protein BK666_05190 [Pseudomonas frederiksbergensis]|uniref:Uncharacterized protein n=1 Tax=Pseudomonas frederiksbergensis TaxID=104087 RepID=A0A423KDM6_9PSED|nr:hypothetical protein [Pseudomonas frederiksbergensis]RON50524.1 hypothetical protein BK666_05190 [Pseudomonas frederiksbergensis]
MAVPISNAAIAAAAASANADSSASSEATGESVAPLERTYSPATLQKIKAVHSDEQLLKNDVCTGVMQEVVKVLCAREYTNNPDYCEPVSPRSMDGIYTVVLNFGADIRTEEHTQGWEHGMAFQKIGHDIVLYQGWVSKFSLGDWLTGEPLGVCHPMREYSPAQTVGNNINTFIEKIKGLKDALIASSEDEFVNELYKPFMLLDKLGPIDKIQGRMSFNRRELFKCHWKHFHFQADKPDSSASTGQAGTSHQ